MFNVRPAESHHYLARPRLLERLPDEPGHCVWLEAPYGYGKSILASQWALDLEERGWRVQWFSLAGRDPRITLAQRLGLPDNAPWGVLLEQLWAVPTLLVMEELEGDEDLSMLLKGIGGLLLLASRQHLPYPPLAQLLAFATRQQGHICIRWRQTKGWPLPLHFAALSDELPTGTTLLEGVRRSVSAEAWRELLFLAAAEQVDSTAASGATRELAKAGFVQELSGAYRLHPLVGDAVIDSFHRQVHTELDANAQRMEPHERGLAFERAGHYAALMRLLASGEGSLEQHQPEAFLRWHELVPDDGSNERRLFATVARLLLDRIDEALPDATRLVSTESLAASLRAQLAGIAVFALSGAKRFEAAESFASKLQGLIAELEPLEAGAAWRRLASLAYMRGRFEETEQRYHNALAAFAPAEPSAMRALAEAKVKANLYSLALDVRGEIEGPLASQLELMEKGGLDDITQMTLRQNAAVNLALLNDEPAAVAQLKIALPLTTAYGKLLVESILAFLTRDLSAFPRLLAAARKWEHREQCERVSAMWLRALRRSGDLSTAFEVEPRLQRGPFTDLEMLWAHEARGDIETARALLAGTRDAYPYREYALHWHAANYLLERTDAALDELLSLTLIRERILPYVGLPLSTLPRSRPELARGYPLKEVLASGWNEAISLRLTEVPPLDVTLLGEVSVRVLDEEVTLTERQQQLLVLLLLGFNREQAGEALWPEIDIDRQRNNLAVQLNLLRRSLEPWGVPTYLFKDGVRHVITDHERLNAALSGGDALTVFELYREPFAGGLMLDAIIETQHHLRERVVSLLYASAAAAGDERAVAYLSRILELEPLHEEALQELLKLLASRGRTHEARKRYERFAKQLALETGLKPHSKTAELAAGARSL